MPTTAKVCLGNKIDYPMWRRILEMLVPVLKRANQGFGINKELSLEVCGGKRYFYDLLWIFWRSCPTNNVSIMYFTVASHYEGNYIHHKNTASCSIILDPQCFLTWAPRKNSIVTNLLAVGSLKGIDSFHLPPICT